jgi:phospholipid/cholesterol/gamma-HCH transport system permease protein
MADFFLVYGSIGFGDRPNLLDLLKGAIHRHSGILLCDLAGGPSGTSSASPHYPDDISLQMDTIGVGSLLIVVLWDSSAGAVMALQMYRALAQYGQWERPGQLVSITLVRELGPVLTAVMVAGRNSSGIASELGSMKVTEQIDAMRALGTDPIQKLVTPRLIATGVMLPLLVIIGDFVGMFGGWVIRHFCAGPALQQYWSTAWQALEWNDVMRRAAEAVSCSRS